MSDFRQSDNPISKSPTTRPRTKPPEVRREELMDRAEELFLQQGVASTNIRDIVAAADVAQGTFYLYFKSKDCLLAALQQRFIQSMCEHLKAAMDRRPPDDWEGRLRAWVAAGVAGYLDRVALHDIVFHEYRPENRRLKHDNAIVRSLADFLRDGTAAGAWSVVDPQITAITFFWSLHGAVDSVIVGDVGNLTRDELVAGLQELFIRGVAVRA